MSWLLRLAPGVLVLGCSSGAQVVSRAYPRAVAGDLDAIEHPSPGHLLVRFAATAATRGLPSEVSMSPDYATGYEVAVAA